MYCVQSVLELTDAVAANIFMPSSLIPTAVTLASCSAEERRRSEDITLTPAHGKWKVAHF